MVVVARDRIEPPTRCLSVQGRHCSVVASGAATIRSLQGAELVQSHLAVQYQTLLSSVQLFVHTSGYSCKPAMSREPEGTVPQI
jgi:hypothetical protein